MATTVKAKKNTTRAQRKVQAKRKALKVTKTNAPAAVPVDKRPANLNPIHISRSALAKLWSGRAAYSGIMAVFGILYLVMVRSLTSGVDVAALRTELGGRVVGSLPAFTQLLAVAGPGSDQAASAYQIVLFIIISLALIWAFRRQYKGEPITVRAAYYRSTQQLVPFVLVLLVLVVQLLPLIVATSVYRILMSLGIAATVIENVFWAGLTLVLSGLSLYLASSTVFAVLIATIPDMTPIAALKGAHDLVRNRRWTILRNLIFLMIALLLMSTLIMVPVIAFVPLIAQWLMLLLGAVVIVLSYSFIFTMYEELLRD